MLHWILSMLGVTPYLPPTSSFRGTEGTAPDADGSVAVTYQPGQKNAFSPAEVAEEQDHTRKSVTDKDLVWPGKVETIHIRNEEQTVFRYDLTITDLDPSFYVRKPPAGGVIQPEGGVLLQPGEEAVFEIVFVPQPNAEKARVRTFSFVITRFDPRRISDHGEILGDLPARWVSLPTAADFKLEARPPHLIIRPWRRSAVFKLDLLNRSNLPPTINLKVVRAPTKEALSEKPEPVGQWSQALESRRNSGWHCLLQSPGYRNSYFATVNGSARVADGMELPVALPQPIFVRYVPWLRAVKDWIFLFFLLFFIMWAVWGIPVRKAPLVRAKLEMPGGIPDGGYLSDLEMELVPKDDRGRLLNPIKGRLDGEEFVFDTLPSRWLGYRWPLGWSGWNQSPMGYILRAQLKDEEKKDIFEAFDFRELRSEMDGGDKDFTFQFRDARGERPVFGEWVERVTVYPKRRRSIRINLQSKDLGYATGKADTVKIEWEIDGRKSEQSIPVPKKDRLSVENFDLNAKPGGKRLLRIRAITSPYQIISEWWVGDVEPKTEASTITLKFSPAAPKITVYIPPIGVPYYVTISHPKVNGRVDVPDGREVKPQFEIVEEDMAVDVNVYTMDGKPLGGQQLTIKSSQAGQTIQIPVTPPPSGIPPTGPEGQPNTTQPQPPPDDPDA
jgi:hypothetical protein